MSENDFGYEGSFGRSRGDFGGGGQPESGGGQPSETDSQIRGLRANPAFMDENHPEHKEVMDKIHGLYESKGDGKIIKSDSIEVEVPFIDNENKSGAEGEAEGGEVRPDLREAAYNDLIALENYGVEGIDYDRELEDLTQEKAAGFKNMRLIEENKFDELKPSITSAAFQAGFPANSVQFLRDFVSNIAQADDDLTKDILRAVTKNIYKRGNGRRKVRS